MAWGMRLRNTALSFPRAMMLGALQDNRLIYDMGKEVARECRRLGVHIDFAPVADVNNNSKTLSLANAATVKTATTLPPKHTNTWLASRMAAYWLAPNTSPATAIPTWIRISTCR